MRLTRLSVSRCVICPSSAFCMTCRPRSLWTLPSSIRLVTSWAKIPVIQSKQKTAVLVGSGAEQWWIGHRTELPASCLHPSDTPSMGYLHDGEISIARQASHRAPPKSSGCWRRDPIALAQGWGRHFESGEVVSQAELARQSRGSTSHVSQVPSLLWFNQQLLGARLGLTRLGEIVSSGSCVT